MSFQKCQPICQQLTYRAHYVSSNSNEKICLRIRSCLLMKVNHQYIIFSSSGPGFSDFSSLSGRKTSALLSTILNTMFRDVMPITKLSQRQDTNAFSRNPHGSVAPSSCNLLLLCRHRQRRAVFPRNSREHALYIRSSSFVLQAHMLFRLWDILSLSFLALEAAAITVQQTASLISFANDLVSFECVLCILSLTHPRTCL